MVRLSATVVAALAFGLVAIAGPTAAQNGADAARPVATGTRLVTLGTRGGPMPDKERAQSSNLLIVNGTAYLIDAGGGVTNRLVQAGVNVRALDKIFITHVHSDHMAGLATLLASEWETQRTIPVDIYGSGVGAVVKGAIAFLTPNAEIRWSEGRVLPMAAMFQAHDIGPGNAYTDRNVNVTAVENTHFHFTPGSPAYGKYKSFSYRFDTPGRSVVFTGDTGPSEAVTELAKDADLLVTEVAPSTDELVAYLRSAGTWQKLAPAEQAGFIQHIKEEHLTADDVGALASRSRVKTVVLTHLSQTADPNETYQRFADAVKAHFSGRVVVAKDLMQF